MGRNRNYLAIQLERYLSYGNNYRPIWKKWRSITASLMFSAIIGWSVVLLIAFLIAPVFFSRDLLGSRPYVQLIILAFPFLLLPILIVILTLVRYVFITFGKRITDNDFIEIMCASGVHPESVKLTRLVLSQFYCIEPDMILPSDSSRSLSRYGVLSHPCWTEFVENLDYAVRQLNLTQHYALDKLDELHDVTNVKAIVLHVEGCRICSGVAAKKTVDE